MFFGSQKHIGGYTHHQSEEGFEVLRQYDALRQYVTKETAFGQRITLNMSSKNNLFDDKLPAGRKCDPVRFPFRDTSGLLVC